MKRAPNHSAYGRGAGAVVQQQPLAGPPRASATGAMLRPSPLQELLDGMAAMTSTVPTSSSITRLTAHCVAPPLDIPQEQGWDGRLCHGGPEGPPHSATTWAQTTPAPRPLGLWVPTFSL